jgi:hypothetical protein
MEIKLIGDLDPELLTIGLKPGDIIKEATLSSKVSGVVHFEIWRSGLYFNCSVWPDNYEIIINPN